jgi:CheY-like chemotaxis protein
MGGEVGVESKPGVGSTFWFTARLARADAAAARPGDGDPRAHLRRDHAGARVLLVEDNAVNRELAVDLLEDVGLAVEVAEDGAQAVRKAREGAYALILMDMQMPEMDGLDATRAIRALPACGQVPIIALTANAFSEDRAACEQAGMSDFLVKPVSPRALWAAVGKWLGPLTAAAAPGAPAAAARPGSR